MLRLPKNNLQLVSGRLSWIRKYASEDINLSRDSVAGVNARVSLLQQVKNLFRPNHYREMYLNVMIHSLDLGLGMAMETGSHRTDLGKTAQLALHTVIDYLHGRKRMISKFEEIYQIATAAAMGDRKIGVLVAKAFEKVGNDGICVVTDGKNPKIELEVMNVMKLTWRLLSPFFLTEFEFRDYVLENPLVLIFESKIWNKNVVAQAITMAGHRHLLIFIEDVEDAAVGSIILDKSGLLNKVIYGFWLKKSNKLDWTQEVSWFGL